MKTKGIIIGIALSTICVMGYSQTNNTKHVTKRQVTQRERIHQGRKSGELTKGEAARLNMQQRHIKQTKKAAKADGVVTPKERAHIRHEQNRANANIAVKKHNDKTRK